MAASASTGAEWLDKLPALRKVEEDEVAAIENAISVDQYITGFATGPESPKRTTAPSSASGTRPVDLTISPRLRFERIEKKASTIDYRKDGDWKMEMPEAKAERRKLRKSAAILKWIHVFWRTYRFKNQKSGILRAEYMKVYCLISKALSKKFDEMDTLKLAFQDWERDIRKSSSASGLDKKAYIESLFELCDIWTLSLEEGEYVHFLATLFHRITRVRTWLSRTGQVMCKYVWQKQRKVKSSLAYRPYMTKEQREAESKGESKADKGDGDDDEDKVAGEEDDTISSSGSDSDSVDDPNGLTPRRLATLSDSGTSTERTTSHKSTGRPGTGYISVPTNRSNDSNAPSAHISGPFFVQPGAPVRPHVEPVVISPASHITVKDARHRRQMSDGVIIEDIDSNPSLTAPTISITPISPNGGMGPITPTTPSLSPSPSLGAVSPVENLNLPNSGRTEDKSPSLGGQRLAMRRASMTFPSSPIPELTQTPSKEEQKAKRTADKHKRRASRQSGDSDHRAGVGDGVMQLPEVMIEPPADVFLASPTTSMPGTEAEDSSSSSSDDEFPELGHYYDDDASEAAATGKKKGPLGNGAPTDDRKRARKNLKDRKARRIEKERQKAHQKELLMKRIAELQAVLKTRKPLKRSTTPPHERPARILRVQAAAPGAGGRKARRRRDRRRHSVGGSMGQHDLVSLPSGPESRPPSAPAFFPGRARPGSHRKRRSNASSHLASGVGSDTPPIPTIRATSLPVAIDPNGSPIPSPGKRESPPVVNNAMGGGILGYKRFDTHAPKELDHVPGPTTGGLVADRRSAHRRRSVVATGDNSDKDMAATNAALSLLASSSTSVTTTVPKLRPMTKHIGGEIPLREDLGPLRRNLARRQQAELEREAAAIHARRKRAKATGAGGKGLTNEEWERKHREEAEVGFSVIDGLMEHMRRARVGYADGKELNIATGAVKRKLKKKPTGSPPIKPLKLEGLLPPSRTPLSIGGHQPSVAATGSDQSMTARSKLKANGVNDDLQSNADSVISSLNSDGTRKEEHMADIASLANEIKKAANSFVSHHRRNVTLKTGGQSSRTHRSGHSGNNDAVSPEQSSINTIKEMPSPPLGPTSVHGHGHGKHGNGNRYGYGHSESPDPDPFDMGIRPDHAIPIEPARPQTADSIASQSASDDEYDIDIHTGKKTRKKHHHHSSSNTGKPKRPGVDDIDEYLDEPQPDAPTIAVTPASSLGAAGADAQEAGWWRDQIDEEAKRAKHAADMRAKGLLSPTTASNGNGNGDDQPDTARTLANRQRIVDRQQRKHQRRLRREARARGEDPDAERNADRKRKAKEALAAAAAAATAKANQSNMNVPVVPTDDTLSTASAEEAAKRAAEVRRTMDELGIGDGNDQSRPVSSMAREAKFLEQQIADNNGNNGGNDNDSDESPDDFDMDQRATSGMGMAADGTRVKKSKAERAFERQQKARHDDHHNRKVKKQERKNRRHAGEAQMKRTPSERRAAAAAASAGAGGGSGSGRRGHGHGSGRRAGSSGGSDISADDEADSRPDTGISVTRHTRGKSTTKGPLARVKSDLATKFDQSLAALTAQMDEKVDSPITRVGSGKFGRSTSGGNTGDTRNDINIHDIDSHSTSDNTSGLTAAGIPSLATVVDNEGGDTQRSLSTHNDSNSTRPSSAYLSGVPSAVTTRANTRHGRHGGNDLGNTNNNGAGNESSQGIPSISMTEAEVILERLKTGDSSVHVRLPDPLPSAADFQKYWMGHAGFTHINGGRPLTAEEQHKLLDSARRSLASRHGHATGSSYGDRPLTQGSNSGDIVTPLIKFDSNHENGYIIGSDGLPVYLTSLDTTGRRRAEKHRAELAAISASIDVFEAPHASLTGEWSHRSAMGHLPYNVQIQSRIVEADRAAAVHAAIAEHRHTVGSQRHIRSRDSEEADRAAAIASRDRRTRAARVGQDVIAARAEGVRQRRAKYRADGTQIMPGDADHIDIGDLDSLPSVGDIDNGVDLLTIHTPHDDDNPGNDGNDTTDIPRRRRRIDSNNDNNNNGDDNDDNDANHVISPTSLADRTLLARRLDREWDSLHGGVVTGAYTAGRKLMSPGSRAGATTRRLARDVQLLADELSFHQSLDRLSQKDKSFAELVSRAAARAEQWQMSQWDTLLGGNHRILSATQREHALLEMALDAEREAERELQRLLSAQRFNDQREVRAFQRLLQVRRRANIMKERELRHQIMMEEEARNETLSKLARARFMDYLQWRRHNNNHGHGNNRSPVVLPPLHLSRVGTPNNDNNGNDNNGNDNTDNNGIAMSARALVQALWHQHFPGEIFEPDLENIFLGIPPEQQPREGASHLHTNDIPSPNVSSSSSLLGPSWRDNNASKRRHRGGAGGVGVHDDLFGIRGMVSWQHELERRHADERRQRIMDAERDHRARITVLRIPAANEDALVSTRDIQRIRGEVYKGSAYYWLRDRLEALRHMQLQHQQQHIAHTATAMNHAHKDCTNTNTNTGSNGTDSNGNGNNDEKAKRAMTAEGHRSNLFLTALPHNQHTGISHHDTKDTDDHDHDNNGTYGNNDNNGNNGMNVSQSLPVLPTRASPQSEVWSDSPIAAVRQMNHSQSAAAIAFGSRLSSSQPLPSSITGNGNGNLSSVASPSVAGLLLDNFLAAQSISFDAQRARSIQQHRDAQEQRIADSKQIDDDPHIRREVRKVKRMMDHLRSHASLSIAPNGVAAKKLSYSKSLSALPALPVTDHYGNGNNGNNGSRGHNKYTPRVRVPITEGIISSTLRGIPMDSTPTRAGLRGRAISASSLSSHGSAIAISTVDHHNDNDNNDGVTGHGHGTNGTNGTNGGNSNSVMPLIIIDHHHTSVSPERGVGHIMDGSPIPYSHRDRINASKPAPGASRPIRSIPTTTTTNTAPAPAATVTVTSTIATKSLAPISPVPRKRQPNGNGKSNSNSNGNTHNNSNNSKSSNRSYASMIATTGTGTGTGATRSVSGPVPGPATGPGPGPAAARLNMRETIRLLA